MKVLHVNEEPRTERGLSHKILKIELHCSVTFRYRAPISTVYVSFIVNGCLKHV